MRKLEAIACIKEDLNSNPQLEDICRSIVMYLANQTTESLRRISFGALSRAAGLKESAQVLPAVQYLSGARLHLLDIQYVFIDDDEEFEIHDEEIAEAKRTGVFYHPDLGERVPDFEKLIYMYFTLSADAADLSREDRQ